MGMMEEIVRIRQECPLSDIQILGDILDPADRQHDFIISNNYYIWYASVARYLKPRRIGEIGVRLGYSIKAMLAGTMAAGVPIGEVEVYGWDNESYIARSVSRVCDYYAKIPLARFDLKVADTNRLNSLGVFGLDLIQVDGDHTTPAAYHDLHLATHAIRPGGVILIDDIWEGSPVRVAADRFCAEKGIESILIPHLRQMYLIQLGG